MVRYKALNTFRKSIIVKLCYTFRQRNRLQLRTVLKAPALNVCQAVRQSYRRKTCTIQETLAS